MIYHRGGEPEWAMHCWFNVMVHKPWIMAEFVTVCCSMSMVSKTSCSHFFSQWSYWGYTHALTKLHTEVISWISRAYECRLCMAYLNTKRDLHCLWAACPCLSWSAVAMRALTWAVFVPRASFTSTLHSGSSPSPMQQRAGPITCMKLPVHVQSSWNI